MSKILISVFVIAMSASVAKANCSPACDLNGDGARGTVLDYSAFLTSFGSKKGDAKFLPAADLDGNGSITAADWGTLNKFCPLGG